mmetsp:Transcript_12347/g.17592  ORF Transcript_12347/g.17592 Transcript_12347/m.17592 type:complete len:108 (-) Transcript_12347:1574-1897(-)
MASFQIQTCTLASSSLTAFIETVPVIKPSLFRFQKGSVPYWCVIPVASPLTISLPLHLLGISPVLKPQLNPTSSPSPLAAFPPNTPPPSLPTDIAPNPSQSPFLPSS